MIKVLVLILTVFFVTSKHTCPQGATDQLQLAVLTPQCFRQLYDSQIHDGHKLSRIINERIVNYKRILQDIKMSDWQHLRTHPVVKWAQSQSQIFLNIRLSHRHDSPTCSDIRFQKLVTNVKLTQSDVDETVVQLNQEQQLLESPKDQPTEHSINQTAGSHKPSTFLFTSQCFFTHQKLLFDLNITFNSILSKLTVKKQGFGRYTVIGEKLKNEIWVNPFTGWSDAGIWTDMREKYAKEMDMYFEMLQGRQQGKSSKGRRRSKGRRQRSPASQL